MAEDDALDYTTLAAEIVAAYVSNNKVTADQLSSMIGDVHQALKGEVIDEGHGEAS